MDSKIKLIFFGTPDIAVECLKALVENDDFEVLAVVTQEDKPVGRKQVMTPPAVKVYAEDHGLLVYQPACLKDDDELYEVLAALNPDYNVVVAYGQMMSQKWLDIPSKRSVNLHVSLLPKYRGASPMQEALKNGDTQTGVCIQEMVFKLDAGDILAQEEFEIAPDDTFHEVYGHGGKIGAKLLTKVLREDFEGRITPVPQNPEDVSYCTKITKQDGLIDFSTMDATEIYNKYRAYKMWPGIYTFWNDKRVKLTEIKLTDESGANAPAGTWGKDGDKLFVNSLDGVVEIIRCQLEGKKEMSVTEVLRGM